MASIPSGTDSTCEEETTTTTTTTKKKKKRVSKAERLAKRTLLHNPALTEEWENEGCLESALDLLLRDGSALENAEGIASRALLPCDGPISAALGPHGPFLGGGVIFLSLIAREVATLPSLAVNSSRTEEGAKAGGRLRVRTLVHFARRFGKRVRTTVAANDPPSFSSSSSSLPSFPRASSLLTVSLGLGTALVDPLLADAQWEAAAALSDGLGLPPLASSRPSLRIALMAMRATAAHADPVEESNGDAAVRRMILQDVHLQLKVTNDSKSS